MVNRVGCLLLASAFSCFAQSGDEATSFVGRSQKIAEEALHSADPNGDTANNIAEADRIARKYAGSAASAASASVRSSAASAARVSRVPAAVVARPNAKFFDDRPRLPGEKQAYIFISDSLPDGVIADALSEASLHGCEVVVRGIRPGAKISDFAKARLSTLLRNVSPIPSVQINPRPFSELQIKVVPSAAILYGDKVISASGTVSLKFLREQAERGATGDLGRRGEVWEIAENDLVDEMKSRIGQIDLEAHKQHAIDNFWSSAKFMDLPHAKEDRHYLFDPSVEVLQDIVTPSGAVIARAGERFNPLKLMPFSKTLVIFDATDAAQSAYAKRIANEAFVQNRGAILVTTKIDRTGGWKSFEQAQTAVAPFQLTLLNEAMVSRFQLGAVPTVVIAEGLSLRVHEVLLQPDHQQQESDK